MIVASACHVPLPSSRVRRISRLSLCRGTMESAVILMRVFHRPLRSCARLTPTTNCLHAQSSWGLRGQGLCSSHLHLSRRSGEATIARRRVCHCRSRPIPSTLDVTGCACIRFLVGAASNLLPAFDVHASAGHGRDTGCGLLSRSLVGTHVARCEGDVIP